MEKICCSISRFNVFVDERDVEIPAKRGWQLVIHLSSRTSLDDLTTSTTPTFMVTPPDGASTAPTSSLGRTYSAEAAEFISKMAAKLALTDVLALPNTKVKIPRIGFGVYESPREQCVTSCLTALKVGYRHIDSAQ